MYSTFLYTSDIIDQNLLSLALQSRRILSDVGI